MAVIGAQRPDYGSFIVSVAAFAGAIISLFNYFNPDSGIRDTAGALLVIITSLVICVIGLSLGTLRRRRLAHRSVLALCLVLIAGCAFAAYLLESTLLLILMIVCLVGWTLHAMRKADFARARA